jgi:polar amino acid transport system substrate-binding protein
MPDVKIARNRYALEHWIRRFARRIRLPRRKTERIVRASYLLDVGQVPYLPVSSDGTEPPESASYSLSDEALEQVSVRWRSADFVRELLGFVEIERILRHVHERWDGSGFPDGLRGQEIPLESRVLHLMDEFVSAWYLERDELSALSKIKSRRGEFDPKLVRALEGMVGDGR